MPVMIAVDTAPEYAPGCYLICRARTTPDGDYTWDPRDGKNTVLIQNDTDIPGVAREFGWLPTPNRTCLHTETDGSVDCPECGRSAVEFISEAAEYLDDCIATGEVVEDPGYFGSD
jgi:hypothetical protein